MSSDINQTLATHESRPGESRPGRSAAKPALRPARRETSVSAGIYRDLRGDILSLRRKPGEPLVEKQIAETYGVSRTPVHEAVLKLADEGLIEIFPQSGTFIARIPINALPEAIAIRRVLEEAAARFAAQGATGSQIARLRANLEFQREMEAKGDLEAFHQADEEFHALLAEIAGYPGFWTVVQQVKVQVDRYRRLTLPVRGRMAMVIGEHEAIADAIAAHDPEGAVRAIDTHIDDLQIAISEARQANPLYFSFSDSEPVR